MTYFGDEKYVKSRKKSAVIRVDKALTYKINVEKVFNGSAVGIDHDAGLAAVALNIGTAFDGIEIKVSSRLSLDRFEYKRIGIR